MFRSSAPFPIRSSYSTSRGFADDEHMSRHDYLFISTNQSQLTMRLIGLWP
ncbi:hypothetical protein LIA77_08764 [Sarocladium implicatum]|nr:hypothetical protein LIA77_08764 [Sarocladium implicatum]